MNIPETPAWARARMDERGIIPGVDADGNPLTERYFDFISMDDARRAYGVVDDLDAHAVVHNRHALVDAPHARFEQYCQRITSAAPGAELDLEGAP